MIKFINLLHFLSYRLSPLKSDKKFPCDIMYYLVFYHLAKYAIIMHGDYYLQDSDIKSLLNAQNVSANVVQDPLYLVHDVYCDLMYCIVCMVI